MATAEPQPQATPPAVVVHRPQQLILISHSSLFYWWPVWAFGYLMALLTLLHSQQVDIGGRTYMFNPSPSLGVIYAVVLFLTIMITNVSVRGLASVIVILAAFLFVITTLWLGLWDPLLNLVSELNVYMNLGFYVFFSTLMFVVWAVATFGYDRTHYWCIRPGQLTVDYVFGAGAKSFNTEGMVVEKFRQDVFRHWILGFGSADLKIIASGVVKEEMFIPNVLFADSKVARIQELIALRPVEEENR
jgi:hypothetical protein